MNIKVDVGPEGVARLLALAGSCSRRMSANGMVRPCSCPTGE